MKNAGWIGALVLLVAACGSDPNGGPGGEPSGSPPGTAPPVAQNGAIAFIRVDPDDVLDDGTIPTASLVIQEPGGGQQVIASAGRATPSWSPDGSTLAYSGGGGIWTVEPGQRPRRLTRCAPSTCVGDGSPAWSPVGATLAFGSDRGGSEGLWTVPVDGGEPVLLVGDLSVRGSPAWSPDGATIAVVATSTGGGAARVLLLDAATGTTRATLAPSAVAFGETVTWSPDGSSLLVAAAVDDRAGGNEAVYVMRPDGSSMRLLTTCRGSSCIDVWPAWSPDGERVVFTRGRCDDRGSDCYSGDLYVMPAGGGQSQRLTEGPSLDCCAAWQPVPLG